MPPAPGPTSSSAGSPAAGRSTPSCPGPSGFAAASQFVRPEDVAEQIPCGSDVEAIVKAVKPFVDAGFTDVALVQIGGEHQDAFLDAAESELLPALRERLA